MRQIIPDKNYRNTLEFFEIVEVIFAEMKRNVAINSPNGPTSCGQLSLKILPIQGE